jgi:cadmium resistance protein CadD (predicted permease)
MGEILTIVVIAAGAFIGTNLDNLLLLVALHRRFGDHARMVTAGYFSGMILIGAISFVIGEAGEFVPIAYLGLLGLIPILIGVHGLIALTRNKQSEEMTGPGIYKNHHAIFITVLMTQLSNSADSIITFSVLFADSADVADYLIAPTFLAMTGGFAWLSLYALKRRRLGNFLARYGNYVTPFILILVGIYVLSNTASDLMPG